MMLFDIDYFKSFNDNYGHLTGDQVLRLVAMTLKQNVKGQTSPRAMAARNSRSCCPRPPAPGADGGRHIRRAVMSKELKKKSTGEILGRVTISAGVAVLSPRDDADSLIERADSNLYAAKRNGRNRVICEADPEYQPEFTHTGGVEP